MKPLLGSLLAALFPPACIACGRVGQAFCAACRPEPAAVSGANVAGLEVRSLGPYEGALRRAVLALKGGRRDVGAILGALLAERCGNRLAAGALLVPVPTTQARRRSRGFDQAELLARAVAAETGLTCAGALARRSGGVQHGRSRSERLLARERFRCSARMPLAGRTVVLIDDVVTTGATLADCGSALREAGATLTTALVVARTCIAGREPGVLGIASSRESNAWQKPFGTTP